MKNKYGKIIIAIIMIFVLGLLTFEYFMIKQLRSTLAVLENQVSDNYQKTAAEINDLQEEVDIYLPETIYVSVDVTTELYDSQITSLGEKISDYNVNWVCEIGKNMERKFTITGMEDLVGDYPLKFEIYDNKLNLVASKEITLSIVDTEIPDTIKVLTIGDSLSSNSSTYRHLKTLSGGNIEFVGSMEVDGYSCEARLGFTARDYLSKTYYTYEKGNPLQPFYYSETGTFDWDYYKKTTGCDPDVIEIFLGTNGINVDPEDNGDNIIKIIDLIREADQDIPIYMVNTIYTANQDGIGSWQNYHNVALLQGRFKFEEDVKVFNLMVYLAENLADYDKVYLVPAAITVDSANVFDTNTEYDAPYVSNTIEVPDNGIHPGDAGYYQIADTIYSTICGTIDDWYVSKIN